VVVSIVGIDDVPVGYYRDKVEVERLVRISGVPYTIQRATQFHNLLDQFFLAQRRLPSLLVPALRFQPVAVSDVAQRLTELVESAPAGRVPDVGGPEQRTARDLAQAWLRACGSRRPVVSVRLPGRAFARYAGGQNLVPGRPYGRLGFEDYLAERYGRSAPAPRRTGADETPG